VEESLLDTYRRTDSITHDVESANAAVTAYVPRTESARTPAARKYAGRATSRRGNQDGRLRPFMSYHFFTLELENDDDDDDDDDDNDDDNDDMANGHDNDDDSSRSVSSSSSEPISNATVSTATRLADAMEAVLARNQATANVQLLARPQRSDNDIEQARMVKRQMELIDVALDTRIRSQRAVNFARSVPSSGVAFADPAIAERRRALSQSLVRLLGVLDDLRRATAPANLCPDELVDADAPPSGAAAVWKRLDSIQESDAAARRETVLHWSSKLQASRNVKLGATQALNQDILTQVDRIMADKERVLRRCRTTHTEYRVIGEAEARQPQTVHDDVYDDTEFYHALLRQVISRQSELNGSVAEREQAAMQRARKRARTGFRDSTMRKGRRLQ
jgi:protein AATF/BFR2